MGRQWASGSGRGASGGFAKNGRCGISPGDRRLTDSQPGFARAVPFFYFNMLKYAKPIWHSMYEQDEMWGKSLSKPLGWWLSTRLLRRVLRAEQPDVVIATHAYCLSALAYAKKRRTSRFGWSVCRLIFTLTAFG